MINLAVIGAGSMVGSRFCELSQNDFQLIEADYNQDISIDITDKNSVPDFFKRYQFDWLIIFSAFTDVDEAEKQRENKEGSCWKINVDGVRNIVNESKLKKNKVILISTDFVFDGEKGPYTETDPWGPDFKKLSWYGITKVESEKAMSALPGSIVLRISYPYRAVFEKKEDIARRTLRLFREKKLYPMFSDQTITPTFIDDLAPAIKLLIERGENGTFHLGSPELTSQWEFASEVIKRFEGTTGDIEKGSLKEFLKGKKVTPRPLNGGFNVEKIKNLGFEPTGWKDGIEKIFLQSR